MHNLFCTTPPDGVTVCICSSSGVATSISELLYPCYLLTLSPVGLS